MSSQTANQIKAYLANILPNLNSSASAIWTRFVDVFSTIIDILTGEIGRSNTIIETAARSLRVMGQQYYIDKALAYQEGDDLVVVNDETLAMGYAEIDTSKQIIKQVYTSVPDNGEIYLKVATTDSDNNLIPLTTQQLDAFKGYMKNWEPVGIAVTVFSQVPDRFDCAHLYVRYSRDYNLIAIQDNIKALLDQFQMQRLNRSALYINDIESAIKDITGVRDAFFDGVTINRWDTSEGEGKYVPYVPDDVASNPYQGIIYLYAGYFNFNDNISDFTADSPITIFESV